MMTAKERLKLIRERNRLMKLLGDKCVMCGSRENLEFDHPEGRDWGQPRDIARSKRLRLYRQDYEAGNLRCLCSDCNKRYLPRRDDVPF